MRLTHRLGWCLVLIGIGWLSGCGSPPPQLPPPEPPTVGIVKPKLTPHQPVKEFTGRLVTKDPVKVIPQVSGRLIRRAFKDGDAVEAGKTVLFEIDPVLFQADVEKGKADIASAEASVKKWLAQIDKDKAELDRLKQLKGVSANELDTATANLKVSEAQLDASRATKAAAQAQLVKAEESRKYCLITAPTSGRIGQALVSIGTLVDAYKTELVSIYPIDPIYAVWEVDELTSLWYREQIRAGQIQDPRNPTTPLTCTIKLKDEKDFSTNTADRSHHGVIDYVDPEIVRGTGTRILRATFENPSKIGPNGQVIPPILSAGDSVRVRVSAGTARPVLTIPESVVFNQQRKQYVYVVVEGKAQLREVELGAAFEGLVEVNRRASPTAVSGLDETDTVIADNLLRVRPGIPVTMK